MKISIYQLDGEARDKYFQQSYDSITADINSKLPKSFYKQVYKGDTNDNNDLNTIYSLFHEQSPKNFLAHNLTVSDVVGIDTDGDELKAGDFYFCDNVGWQKLIYWNKDNVIDESLLGENELFDNEENLNEAITNSSNFEIDNDILIEYKGSDSQVVIPSNVIEIGEQVFWGYKALKTIECSNVTEIGEGTFYNCTNLKSVNCYNVTKINNRAFLRCTNLKSIECPDVIEIDADAFSFCTTLESIELPKVTKINDNAFYSCSPNLTIYSDSDYVKDYCRKNGINYEHLIIPETHTKANLDDYNEFEENLNEANEEGIDKQVLDIICRHLDADNEDYYRPSKRTIWFGVDSNGKILPGSIPEKFIVMPDGRHIMFVPRESNFNEFDIYGFDSKEEMKQYFEENSEYDLFQWLTEWGIEYQVDDYKELEYDLKQVFGMNQNYETHVKANLDDYDSFEENLTEKLNEPSDNIAPIDANGLNRLYKRRPSEIGAIIKWRKLENLQEDIKTNTELSILLQFLKNNYGLNPTEYDIGDSDDNRFFFIGKNQNIVKGKWPFNGQYALFIVARNNFTPEQDKEIKRICWTHVIKNSYTIYFMGSSNKLDFLLDVMDIILKKDETPIPEIKVKANLSDYDEFED